MSSSLRAVLLALLVFFASRDLMATLAAGGGSLVLDIVS